MGRKPVGLLAGRGEQQLVLLLHDQGGMTILLVLQLCQRA